MNDIPTEYENETDASGQTPAEIPASSSEAPAEPPKPKVALFDRVEHAYHDLRNRVEVNKTRVHEQRVQIAGLRSRIRELVAAEHGQDGDGSEEDELRNSKLLVQTDDCNNLIHQIEQIRENIHHNSTQAETLLTPLRSGMELLNLRIRHIRSVEQLLADVKEGIDLQQQLNEADSVLETLEHMLSAD